MLHPYLRLPALSTTLLAVGLLFSAPAWAVYKCETGGQVTYSDTACTDGKTLDIVDNKSNQGINTGQPAKDKAAVQQQRREHAKADRQQAQARAKSEREDARAKLVAEKNKRKCAQLAQRKKWAEDDLRNANAKGQEKARRKSQRASDQYLAECPA